MRIIVPSQHVLIVEDDPYRIQHFEKFLPKATYTDVAQRAIRWLEKEQFDFYFLDHDLGGQYLPSDQSSGFAVADWLSKHGNQGDNVIIHSWNPAGAQRMQKVLPNARYIPFSPQFDIEVRSKC